MRRMTLACGWILLVGWVVPVEGSEVATGSGPFPRRVSSEDSPSEWARKGFQSVEKRDWRGAVEAYREAVRLQPGDETLERNYARSLAGLGYSHLDQKAFEQARDAFEEAGLYEDQANVAYGLGVAHHALGDEEAAIWTLERSINLDPAWTQSYILLGQIYYRRNEMEKALQRLEEAVRLDPETPALQAFYKKVQQGYAAQSRFREEESYHFNLLFEGGRNEAVAWEVREILEEAYREIGQALQIYPERPITVLLYAQREFSQAAHGTGGVPDWAKGLYDGKIHLPIGGSSPDSASLRAVLHHEYTHALVHQVARNDAPTWLNEGLAVYFENQRTNDPAGPERLGPVFPLRALEGSFLKLNRREADRAYAQSASAVGYLIERHGLYRVRTLLELLPRMPFDQAFEEAFLISYAAFEKQWRETLENP